MRKILDNSSFLEKFFSKRRNVALNAILYTFLWGCAFPLVKICVTAFQITDGDQMSVCLLAGIRFTMSGILTLVLSSMLGSDGLKVNRKQFGTILLYGLVATTLQYAFTYLGLAKIDGSKGAVFDQLWVFVIVVISGLFFREERLTIRKILGCVLGFLGVIAVSANGFSFSFRLDGEGWMLLAAGCQTAASLLAKGCSGSLAAPKLVGYGQLMGGVMLTAFALISGGQLTTVNPTAIVSLILLILISSVAYTLSLLPLRYCPVSEVSSYNLLITVFGVVMSGALLGENILRLEYAVSLVLISLGILLINKGPRRLK